MRKGLARLRQSKYVSVLNYTPCRVSEIYFDSGNEIVIRSIDTDANVFRLRGASRSLWLMLDGKNSIETIVNKLCAETGIGDFDGICKDVVAILSRLQLSLAVVANWDPLFKTELSQELFAHE